MSLKHKTVSGVLWVLTTQFGTQGVSFVVSVILARLLLPQDFGLIGMITIIISIGRSLIDSGLASALIRKKEPDNLDFATVFYTNLLASLVIYCVVYAAAPAISRFYHQPQLINLVRVLCLTFVIGAFSSIQNTVLVKKMHFKKLLLVSIPALIAGGSLGIIMAVNGYGVWSLVVMQLVTAVATSVLLWIRSGWVPPLLFSMARLKEHYRFGITIGASAIIDVIFSNLYLIVIGRLFSPVQLGFYTRALTLKQLPVANISGALNKVTYPVFASIQDDDEKLKQAYKKVMQQVIFWVAPILIGMAVLATPIFRLLFTAKWLPAVPYFQILCAEGIMYPLNAYNLNILKVKGRGDLFLKLEIIKKVLVVAGVVIALLYGIYGLLYFQVLMGVAGYFINSYYSGRFLNYPVAQQLKDILPQLGAALVMGFCCYIVLLSLSNAGDVFKILIPTITGIIVYYCLCYWFQLASFLDFNRLLLQKLKLKH